MHQYRQICLLLPVLYSGHKVFLKESKSQWKNFQLFLSQFKTVKSSRMSKSSMLPSVITLKLITRARLRFGSKVLKSILRTNSTSLFFTEKKPHWLRKVSLESTSIQFWLNFSVRSSTWLFKTTMFQSALRFFTRRSIPTGLKLVIFKLLWICTTESYQRYFQLRNHFSTIELKGWTSHWCQVSLNSSGIVRTLIHSSIPQWRLLRKLMG